MQGMPSHGGGAVVAPPALTVYRAREFKDEMLAALDRATLLELDLSRVEEIDVAGLQLLLLAKREAERRGKAVVLSHHSPAALEIIDFCNLAGHFGDPLLVTSPRAD